MKFKAVIFDLDGTLLDTLDDLADSMNAALLALELPTHPTECYRYFVGDGVRELAKRVLPINHQDEELINLTIRRMSAAYDKRWNNKSKPYPGIEELLDSLAELGLNMAVLSNKPDPFTQIMVPALLPGRSFYPVLGARAGIPVKPDPQAALEIAACLEIAPNEIFYIGDTATDMMTANAAGMVAIGAAWGFRTVEELLKFGAKRIIYHPMELIDLIRDQTLKIQ